MKLLGKQLLLLVTDGVDQEEFEELKSGFEEEQAVVLVSTPSHHLTVETVRDSRRGREITVDLPFEAINHHIFDGLIIPDGVLSTELLRKEVKVMELIHRFYREKLPLFASGNAVQLLYDSQVLSDHILVRESGPLGFFVEQAVGMLVDRSTSTQMYRPTIV